MDPTITGAKEGGLAPPATAASHAAGAGFGQTLLEGSETGADPQRQRQEGWRAWVSEVGFTSSAEAGQARPQGVLWSPVLASVEATVPAAGAAGLDLGAARHAPAADATAEATRALIAQVVKAARLAWTQRGGEARLIVDAGPDLGPVQVILQVSRGQVSAALQADAVAVQQALDAARGDLQRGLAEHGLDLHRFAVSVSPDGRRRQTAGEDPAARRPRVRRTDARFEDFA